MKLIVGLGNPGKDYTNTRHNVGFNIIDKYLKKNNYKVDKEKFNGKFTKISINGEDTILLEPLTYMNLSGDSVRKVMDYFNIEVDDILIISDDLDLSIGNFKLRPSGSSGGHNGLKSIESSLGTNSYKRLKIGI